MKTLADRRVTPPRPRRLRDYTSVPFEVFVAAFSVLPFFVLAYFYPALPGRVPLFMRPDGEVAVWAEKGVLSVFRVPLMAVDTQLICLLMKHGVVRSGAEYGERHVDLSVGIWDWLRCLVAFKMSAASLDTIFLSVEDLKFLSRPAFAVTAVAALLSVVGGVVYLYRLRALRRESGAAAARAPLDARRVYGGAFYFNPDDPALFAGKYVFNLGNKWTWAFIACVVAYPLLVLAPV